MRRKTARSPTDQGRVIHLPEPRYRGADRRALPTEERAYLGRLLTMADSMLQRETGTPCPLCRGMGYRQEGVSCGTCDGNGEMPLPKR